MWNPTTRAQHSRAGLRYESDLTDAEWAILCPFLPMAAACGRKWAYPMREVINAICYVLRGGIAWRLMPDTFPPWRTIYRWFARLRDDGTWETINHHLVMQDRERVGREASPTAAVMDRQSVKTTESGGIRGFDAGKKIKGRKRHALVDTDGRALKLQVHAADIQDRDGAGPLLRASLRAGRSCSLPLPTPAIRDNGSPQPALSASRSCTSWKGRLALSSMPGAGW
jgi:transposase